MRNSKKTYLLIFAIAIIAINYSCDKIDELLTFTISNKTEIVIETGIPITLPFEIPTPDITTGSEEQMSNNNSSTDLIKNVLLTSFNMKVTEPSDKTFSFLKSIHIYISTDDSDEIELAYKDNIDSSTNSIDLTTTESKLDKYIKADSYKLRTKITTKETVTQDITIEINMEYKITADPL